MLWRAEELTIAGEDLEICSMGVVKLALRYYFTRERRELGTSCTFSSSAYDLDDEHEWPDSSFGPRADGLVLENDDEVPKGRRSARSKRDKRR